MREALAKAETVRELLSLGVERGFTVWPEWAFAFTHLDKGGCLASPGKPAVPGIENRPMRPPQTMLGKRVGFHSGAHVGGRSGNKAHHEGLYAVTETAKSAGWEIRLMALQRGAGAWVEFHKGDRVVRLDTRMHGLGPNKPVTPGAVGIVRSAITFTAIITGYEEPTDTPKYPWQRASDPNDPEDWSFGWHVTDVVVLASPIPCSGMQGFWPLSSRCTSS